jgi:hypothetical protein
MYLNLTDSHKLWSILSDEEMLPFLVSGNKRIREAAKAYLRKRGR